MIAMRKFCQGALATVLLSVLPVAAQAFIYGSDQSGAGPTATFSLTASDTLINNQSNTAVGSPANTWVWTFSDYVTTGRTSGAQYPSTTLIVKEGQTVKVNLTNHLSEPVSFLVPAFPATAYNANGNPIPYTFPKGDRSQVHAQIVETQPGQTVTYQFTASTPGTYIYQTGSNMRIQLPMGLAGALVVRPKLATVSSVPVLLPAGLQNPTTATPAVTAQGTGGINTIASNGTVTYRQFAYNPANGTDASTAYDREFIYIMTEIDPAFQAWMATFPKPTPVQLDLSLWNPTLFFTNGRDGVDTFLNNNVPWLSGLAMLQQPNIPEQPYAALPVVHPGERLLLRLVNLGKDPHPIHQHGNNFSLVAINGIPLSSGAGSVLADMAISANTNLVKPGETRDVIWSWTGQGLGWDAYGSSTMSGTGVTPHVNPAPYEDLSTHAATHVVSEMTHTLPTGTTNLALPATATYTNANLNGLGTTLSPGISAIPLAADVAQATANINAGALPVLTPATPWITTGAPGMYWSYPILGMAPGTFLNPSIIATNPTNVGRAFPQESINNGAGTGVTPAGSPNLRNPVPNANAYAHITAPVDQTNINTCNSYFFMWHSHAERELTSLGFFPGGMLAMMEVRPWTCAIDNNYDF